MTHKNETFFTVVGCMDGRVQRPIAEYGKQKFGAEFPDTITEAGLVGQLAKELVDPHLLESLRFKIIDVSIGKHNSCGILVHGHEECAGNPVSNERQKDDIRISVKKITEMIGSSLPVVGVFVKRSGLDWIVEEVPQSVTV